MTTKEKAKELINKFYISFPLDDFSNERYIFVKKHSKNCALIAVDEIIKSTYWKYLIEGINYWEEVKKEIELI